MNTETMAKSHGRGRGRRGVLGRAIFLLGAALAAFLLLATLFGRIHLTALNDEAVRIAASIEQQRHQQAKLLIDHEMIYDLANVEAYARQELGMEQPRGDQIRYLETELPDRVTLYRQERFFFGGGSLLDSIGACFQ